MTYQIVVDRDAKASILTFVRYIAEEQCMPETAQRIFLRIWDAIESLDQHPRRCPLAPENDFSSLEIRMRFVTGCLILFHVEDKTQTVNVIGFRHGKQMPLDHLD